MAMYDKKLKALKLRRNGRSLSSIADELDISKGTASLWCRDISLSLFQRAKLDREVFIAGQKGRILGAEMNHKKKVDTINYFNELGKREISLLSTRDFLLIGATLYWGEGCKGEGRFTFINSDPEMITLIFFWLVKIAKVNPADIVPKISINEMHRSRKEKVLKFWVNLLKLPREQFSEVYFIKTPQKKVYENYNNYFGMLTLKVRRGTNLRYKILGLIKAIKEQANAGVAKLVLAPHS